jgi:hypothetical protein
MSILNKGSNEYLENEMRAALGEYYPAFSFVSRIGKINPIQARLPYDPNIN